MAFANQYDLIVLDIIIPKMNGLELAKELRIGKINTPILMLTALNKSGKIYLSHTRLKGQYVLRICIGQTNTEKEHVEKAWQLVQSEAGKI